MSNEYIHALCDADRARAKAESERLRATITALKIALEQAAYLAQVLALRCAAAEQLSGEGPGRVLPGTDAELARFAAMAAPDWEALPVELTAPGGAA